MSDITHRAFAELLAAEAAYAVATWAEAPAALNRLRDARDALAMAVRS
jgi:hypothetical protein